ncbi:uncharacterized protein JCM6883_001766 [Sporobolomyces salmoneus]|uniref:uncharacterized protein n=1 Tax=Sporobolomyces salmoneus TaxID=183962 RepID=UPI0031763FD4
MSQQPRIVLRPPPHRDYLNGYPGIPASDPSKDPPPTHDPLFPLPLLLRPQAHLSGTVEIRSPVKGPPIKAKWLSLELEKIETIPPQVPTSNGHSHSHSHSKDREKEKDKKKEGRFVELIGTGPSRLWIAGEDPGAPIHQDEIDGPSQKKKGTRRITPFRKGGNEEEEEDGFDFIPDGNYPFKIPLPEGLPPSTEIDFKSSGISYQLVASLCIKGKKSLLKSASKPTVLLASASILLHKADILPVFPAYSPLLLPPIPPSLPWAAGDLTVGESRETNLTIRRGFGAGREGSEGGVVGMRVVRKGAAFGPGDQVPIHVELRWNGEGPIRLTKLEFVLREQIVFRYPSPNNSSYLVRSPPRTNSIFTCNANANSNSNDSTPFAVLYKDELVTFDLTGTVPTSHPRVTVRTAKHIDVSYHFQIRALLEGEAEVMIDQWPVVIGNVNARVARGIITDIGYVEGLCERGNLENITTGRSGHAPVESGISSLAPPPPKVTSSPQVDSPAAYSDASTEKRRLLEARSNANGGGGGGSSNGTFHVSNPTLSQSQFQSQFEPSHSMTPERPTPFRPHFTPSPTAEEEKRRYYEAATKSRDTLQGFNRQEQPPSRDVVSPTSMDTTTRTTSDGQNTLSPTSITSLGGGGDTPISPFAYHEASILKLMDRPKEDATATPSRLLEAPPPPQELHVSRSNTTLAASGSAVSFDERSHQPPPPSASLGVGPSTSTSTLLGRSLTSAESEKKRLFLEAKEIARLRQEEARLELERQNKVLEDFEFEEAQRDFEERLILEAEESRRHQEEIERRRFEERLERERLEKLGEFEREQREAQDRRREETDRWARERKEEDEMKKRKAEELRRLDQEKEREELERRGALARKAEMERQRAEDEARRVEGERVRREDNERRQREEYERRMEEEAHRRRVDQERRDEEENRRIYLEQVARLRAEEDALAQQRRNGQVARPNAEQASYPQSHGHPSTSPQRVAYAIDRAPSVASFAPSTSAANADSHFYAQAIASGQQSTLSQEKAEYFRQLRQRQTSGSGSVSPPSSSQQHQHQGYFTQPIREENTLGYRAQDFSSPPRDQAPRSRSTTPTPTAHRALSTNAQTSLNSSSTSNGYKSAAEEKAEAFARRRLEEEQARNALSSSNRSIAPSTVNGLHEEEGDFAAPPPSYPVPVAGGSTVSLAGHAQAQPRSAAEEKEELSAYYRAKQAVENGRQPQTQPQVQVPSVPPRQPTAPTQAYPPSTNGYSVPPPPQTQVQTYPSPASSSSDSSHPHSHLRSRDPEVPLGKQRAESSSSSPEAAHSYPESILRNYSQTPSAPPAPLTHATGGGGYYPTTTNGMNNGRGAQEQVYGTGGGVGVEGFGSFHLEAEFPEFRRIAERIQRGEMEH